MTLDPALAHHDSHLMKGLGQQSPEFPIIVGAAHAGARVSLDRVVQVGEAQRVTEKEYGRIETVEKRANMGVCLACIRRYFSRRTALVTCCLASRHFGGLY